MPFSCITCTYIVHDDVFIKDCEKQKGWTYHHHFSFKKEKTAKYCQRKEIREVILIIIVILIERITSFCTISMRFTIITPIISLQLPGERTGGQPHTVLKPAIPLRSPVSAGWTETMWMKRFVQERHTVARDGTRTRYLEHRNQTPYH